MPSEHYMVEAKLLLGCAAEDIPRSDEIRTIIKDIWDTRMSKLRTSVDTLIKVGGTHAALDNLTSIEINAIRPLLPHALDQLYRIKKVCIKYKIFRVRIVQFLIFRLNNLQVLDLKILLYHSIFLQIVSDIYCCIILIKTRFYIYFIPIFLYAKF